MGQKKGADLGGMKTLDDLIARCYREPEEDGCWHIRTAYGRAYPHNGKPQTVWVHGRGAMTATRAAFLFAKGERNFTLLGKRCVYRICDSHDCCNPEHLRVGTRPQALSAAKRTGKIKAHNVAEAARRTGASRSRLTPELRQWIVESTQSGSEIARVLGYSQGRINVLRQKARERMGNAPRSVFDLGRLAA